MVSKFLKKLVGLRVNSRNVYVCSSIGCAGGEITGTNPVEAVFTFQNITKNSRGIEGAIVRVLVASKVLQKLYRSRS